MSAANWGTPLQTPARLEWLDRRGSPRRKLHLGTLISKSGADVLIHNISSTGMLIETDERLRAGEALDIDLPEVGATTAVVAWRGGNFFGCQFVKPLPKAVLSATLLRNPVMQALPPDAIEIESPEQADEVGSDKFSFGFRLRVILGSSIALWAAILWAMGIIS